MVFCDRLKKLREEKSLTRQDMATVLGIDNSTYGKYELGQREPRHETVRQIANFFDVSTDYLLGLSDTRNPEEIAALSSELDYDDLPPEAIKELEQYKEFLKQKYGKKSDNT